MSIIIKSGSSGMLADVDSSNQLKVVLPTAVATAPAVKITDGTDTASILPASTPAVASDTAFVVALSPNNGVKLVDAAGTTQGTIKAASTSAVAADPALVVAISPNNGTKLTDTAGTN